jgi:aminoglycoside phosphotransferase (APT) family kinase protein
VVLRRAILGWDEGSPQRAREAFNILTILQSAGIAAPRPLFLDAEGEFLGVPTMALSYIPGRSFFHHPDTGAWVDGLAQALAQIHTITPDRFDLTSLPPLKTYPDRIDNDHEHHRAAGPLAIEAHETLVKQMETIAPLGPCLVHNDYWPGNTVWFRGRLVAVVDWASASVGDPRTDVAQCRSDLVFANGLDVADAFLKRYEAYAGPMPDMWYHDAFMGLRALLNYPKWLVGYHDAGMGHLDLADVGVRIEAFLRRALDQAP